MYHFILEILILLSLGAMIYLAARKIPYISDTVEEESVPGRRTFWTRIELALGALPLDRFDFVVSQFLEKNIRKMKLFLAKLDNYLTHHLEQFKKVKHRAHIKQEKKFALFEGDGPEGDDDSAASTDTTSTTADKDR